MAGTVRLIIASAQPELIESARVGLNHKPNIDMVITVARPSEAENKLARAAINVLLVDIDTAVSDDTYVSSMQKRNQLKVLYTSAMFRSLPKKFNIEAKFIPKPAAFTNFTSAQFVTTLYNETEGFIKQNVRPDYRELGRLVDGNNKVILIASSTGGTEALEKIISKLPVDVPPLLIVQHMPSGFTKLFADRLNATYKLEIKEAKTGDFLKRGQLLIAPAGMHMKLVRQQGKLAVECFVGVKIHGVMPAADVLFESATDLLKTNAIGVILTGMGADGAKGLMMMHNAGAKTIGQDAATCVVYGMPNAAKGLGAVDFELPIDKIADKILSLT